MRFADAFNAEVLGRCGPDNGLFHLRLDGDPFELLERHGHAAAAPTSRMPTGRTMCAATRPSLPACPAPYAPTASLHFDEGVLAALAERGVETRT